MEHQMKYLKKLNDYSLWAYFVCAVLNKRKGNDKIQ